MRSVTALALILAAACGGKDPATTAPTPGTAGPAAVDAAGTGKAAVAARIADEIAREPDRMAEILESHGMTADQFEALMYEISEDAALTEAYERARQR